MNKLANPLLLLLVIISSMFSCKKKGCMESNALNYDISAQKSDNSCQYSTVNFYSTFTEYERINSGTYSKISLIEVRVNNKLIGQIKPALGHYPVASECGIPNALHYVCDNHNPFNYESKIYMENGSFLVAKGTEVPKKKVNCFALSVTPTVTSGVPHRGYFYVED